MPKTQFPATTLQPLQVLDFILKGNQTVRAIFSPQPDQTGMKVGHVNLECIEAGTTVQAPVQSKTMPQSLDDALKLAFEFAQSQAIKANAPIISACLEGEEFIEKKDLEQLTSGSIPVTVF